MTTRETYNLIADLFGEATAYEMVRRIKAGERVGQAFFNALPTSWQCRLRGTLHDPFHSDRWEAVEATIDFLTRP